MAGSSPPLPRGSHDRSHRCRVRPHQEPRASRTPEALGRVVREPAGNVAVDGDTVIVVEGDELAEAECAGERTGFVRDAFHHAAVANEYVCVVIDDFEARTIEFARE